MADNIGAFLEELNPQQRAAVESVEGPALIVAGAGSGKTRVLTGRIANILVRGGKPWRIMALTFTKKAAEEMKQRVCAMVGENSGRRLFMGTFHSVFVRFLREYAAFLGYPVSFSIYDASDSLSLVRSCIKELNFSEKAYKPRDVLSHISGAKNSLVTPALYAENSINLTNDLRSQTPDFFKVYELYQAKLHKTGAMDFDDILMNMSFLLSSNPEALEDISGRFDYVLVDEYQDTNLAQYRILLALTGRRRNICVVGDDSQSIYGFRGARIQNILNFKKDFPEAEVYRLEQNYRSTKNIVNAANSLIAKNVGRLEKVCFSSGPEGDRIRLIHAYTEQDEARLVVDSIVTKVRDGRAQYEDFAVLYRVNAQSRALEEALRKRNIPYMIYSGHSFFERAEVKDMVAYFKLAANPKDEEAFRRVANLPARGIGATTVQALSMAGQESGLSLFEVISSDNLAKYGLRDAAVKKLRAFRDMILSISSELNDVSADLAAGALANQSGLYAHFKADSSVEGKSRLANVEELLNSVKSFVEDRQHEEKELLMLEGGFDDASSIDDSELSVVTLGEYLENISLLSSVDVDEKGDEVNNKVHLMTAHSSKGLEFPHVYVTGMEENLFPSVNMKGGRESVEEERRLFYVAITRAKSSVSLSYCDSRMRNGQHESNRPSRFLSEIDSRFISNPLPGKVGPERKMSFDKSWSGSYGPDTFAGRFAARPSTPSRPVSPGRPYPHRGNTSEDFVPMSPLDVRKGQRVEHQRFGAGTVLEVGMVSGETRARVAFDRYGEKVLLLRFAKLRLVGQ